MRRAVLAILAATLFAPACWSEPPRESDAAKPPEAKVPAVVKVTEVSVEEAARLLAETPGIVVLDVRTPGEFEEGHVPGAVNVDFKAPDFAKRLRELPRKTPYLVHCQVGGRSAKARALMESEGFQSIYHLAAGFAGWEAEGKPVEKP